MIFSSFDELQQALERHGYMTERGLATSLYLSLKLPRPMFLSTLFKHQKDIERLQGQVRAWIVQNWQRGATER